MMVLRKQLSASGAVIKTAYEGQDNTNAFTDAEKTKLAGVESGADVTDQANVSAAGAFMKASDDSDDVAEGATHKFVTPSEKDQITKEWFRVDVLDESTALTVATLKTFRVPAAFLSNIIDGIRASVTTAPVGAALIIDLKQNGTSIFSTKLQIDAGQKTSKTSATPAVLRNNATWDDAEYTVEVTQIGSSTAGAGLKLYFRGRENIVTPASLVPDFMTNFDTAVQNLNKVKHYKFGSARTSEGGTVLPITNVSDLGTDFTYKGRVNGPNGDIKINKELQSYVDFTHADNFVFNAQNMELRATLPNPSLLGLLQLSPASAVVNSRNIVFADASQVKIGQVVGFKKPADGIPVDSNGYVNDEGYNNFRLMKANIVRGSITAGDTISVTFTSNNGSWAGSITPLATASAGETATTFAKKLIDAINADATLSAAGVLAYPMPGVAGGYCISQPRGSMAETADFGSGGKGSLTIISTPSTNKTGTITHENKSIITAIFVVAKNGNTVTLNHPVNLSTSSVVTFSPSRLYFVTSAGASGAPMGVADTTGLGLGQLVQLGYQDNNLRPITALTSNTILQGSGSGIPVGLVIGVYPAFAHFMSGSVTANTVIPMNASIPAGIQVGMHCFNYFSSTETIAPILITAIDRTANTITLDTPVTWGSGATIYFFAPIYSAQFVSKWLARPGTDGRGLSMNPIAHRVKGAFFPCAADIGGWPADWLFASNGDTDPGSGSGGSEIDKIDVFTYWNNSNTNNIRTAMGSGTDLYAYTGMSDGALSGNNIGIKKRSVGMIWFEDRVYIYFDDVLVLCRAFAFNKTKRAEFIYNLAVGSCNTVFNGNGFWPIDYSRFPMRQTIEELELWCGPNQIGPLNV